MLTRVDVDNSMLEQFKLDLDLKAFYSYFNIYVPRVNPRPFKNGVRQPEVQTSGYPHNMRYYLLDLDLNDYA